MANSQKVGGQYDQQKLFDIIDKYELGEKVEFEAFELQTLPQDLSGIEEDKYEKQRQTTPAHNIDEKYTHQIRIKCTIESYKDLENDIERILLASEYDAKIIKE